MLIFITYSLIIHKTLHRITVAKFYSRLNIYKCIGVFATVDQICAILVIYECIIRMLSEIFLIKLIGIGIILHSLVCHGKIICRLVIAILILRFKIFNCLIIVTEVIISLAKKKIILLILVKKTS